MNFKVGDKVIVISGKDRGNTGKILKVLRNKQKVVVEGINIIKKHLKPDSNNENGGIIETEAPLHVSNVMLVDLKKNIRTRIGFVIDKNNKKQRITKKSETIIK